MARRVIPALVALLIAAAFSIARHQLVGVESESLSAWPSHVIFGLYFAVLTLALQAFHRIWIDPVRRPQQQLLMLVLACVCADLVLVNVQEVVRGADASYGLVVIWDMATFFVWLRAIELSSSDDVRFERSLAVAITPVLALGREILFLPYGERAERAYLDFVFGNSFVALWPLAVGLGAAAGRTSIASRLGLAVVMCGCVYWLLNAIENLAFLAWPTLPSILYDAAAEQVGVPVYYLSVAYAVVALVATSTIWIFIPRLAARFGLTPADRAAV